MLQGRGRGYLVRAPSFSLAPPPPTDNTWTELLYPLPPRQDLDRMYFMWFILSLPTPRRNLDRTYPPPLPKTEPEQDDTLPPPFPAEDLERTYPTTSPSMWTESHIWVKTLPSLVLRKWSVIIHVSIFEKRCCLLYLFVYCKASGR